MYDTAIATANNNKNNNNNNDNNNTIKPTETYHQVQWFRCRS